MTRDPKRRSSEAGTDVPVRGRLVPRLNLQTLTRGDGLLGLRDA